MIRQLFIAVLDRGRVRFIEDWLSPDPPTWRFKPFNSRWRPRRPYNHTDHLL